MNDVINHQDLLKARKHTAKILCILLGLNLILTILYTGSFTLFSAFMLLLIPLAVLIKNGYRYCILAAMVFLTLAYGYGVIILGNYLGVIGWAVFMYALYKAWVIEQRFLESEKSNKI